MPTRIRGMYAVGCAFKLSCTVGLGVSSVCLQYVCLQHVCLQHVQNASQLICKCVCRQLWLCELLPTYGSCACNRLHEWTNSWQQAAEMCLGATSAPADSSASPPTAPNAAPDAERHGLYGASGSAIAHETHESDARGNASSQSAFKFGVVSAAATSACAAGSAAAGAFELNLPLGTQLIIISVHSSRMQARQHAGYSQIQSAPCESGSVLS